jgi:hypothetical protein
MNKTVDNNITINSIYTQIGNDWLTTGLVVGLIVVLIVSTWNKHILPFLSKAYTVLVDKIRGVNYRYIGLRKHVTVYKNGHGIILHDIELNIYKINEQFEKKLDISDGQESCIFPSLDEMKKTDVEDRFTKFGFWCSSTPKDVIKSVEEVKNRSNSKKKVLKFIFDKNAVEKLKGKPVKILYGFSIPGLYPLNNASLDMTLGGTNPILSEFDVRYPMNYIHYVIGLENGINVHSIEGTYYARGEENSGTSIAVHEKDDLFYSKYAMSVTKPKVGALISTRFTIV